MTVDKLKEKLKMLPFGSEEYIKTLANIIYLQKNIMAKIYTADVCLMGIEQIYGKSECDKHTNSKMINMAYELVTKTNDPGVCLFAAICLVMEGEKKVNETIIQD